MLQPPWADTRTSDAFRTVVPSDEAASAAATLAAASAEDLELRSDRPWLLPPPSAESRASGLHGTCIKNTSVCPSQALVCLPDAVP